MICRRFQCFLWLAIFSLLVTVCSQAQDQTSSLRDLRRLLSDNASLKRYSRPVLKWRRQSKFIRKLLALCTSRKESLKIRLRAIQLVGACGDSSQTAETLLSIVSTRYFPKDLKEPAQRASQRIQSRGRARQFLKQSQKQKLPGVRILLEIEVLALDPLETAPTRSRALGALSQKSPFPGETLLMIIQNEQDILSIRIEAFQIIAQQPRLVDELIPKLLSYKESSLYQKILRSVQSMSNKGGLAVLQRLRHSRSVRERLRACELLGQASWVAVAKDLNQIRLDPIANPALRLEALRALSQFEKVDKTTATREFLAIMNLLSEENRWRAIRALNELPKEFCNRAIALLFQGPTKDERSRAIKLTYALELTDLAPQLRRLAADREEQELNRALAVETLGHQALKENAQTLVDILLSDASNLIRCAAVQALARQEFQGPKTTRALSITLEVKDKYLKRAIIECLAVHGDRQSADRLCQLLRQQENKENTLVILKTLINLPKPRSMRAILDLEAKTRKTAAIVLLLLARFPAKQSVDRLLNFLDHRSINIRAGAWRTLLRWIPPSVMKIPEASQILQYKPNASLTTRKRAITQWRNWWRQNKNSVSLIKR
jgi:hypothetical protein